MLDQNIVTVSQLNTYVKMLLNADANLKSIYLSGEISNFTNHYKSGHFYLSLKDDTALIKAVMFKFNAQKLRFLPENGMKVICKGRVSLYDKDGSYQFYIEEMEPEGRGALQVAYEQLCQTLREQGLFEEWHKKPIPKIPQRVAIVTSPTGAAIHDITNILTRRFPIVQATLFPVLVQGEGAAISMIDALNTIESQQLADVVIIGRGGGSLEDLWAFNDEALARRIYEFSIPIISAVGHEVDYTICDFVADLRAPTPSAAAELAVPDRAEIESYLSNLWQTIAYRTKMTLNDCSNRMLQLKKSPVLSAPQNYIGLLQERLDKDEKYLLHAFSEHVSAFSDRFQVNVAKLNAYSPLNTLSRGYSLSIKDGAIVKSIKQLTVNQPFTVQVADGKAHCTVNEIMEN